MHKSLASNAFTISIFLILFLSIFIGWTQSKLKTEGYFLNPVCIQIQSGENINSVSNKLAELELIKSPVIFRIGANYSKKSTLLKAGSFLIPAKSSMLEIINLITRGGKNTCGKEVLYKIGVTSQKIVVRNFNPNTGKYLEALNFDLENDVRPKSYIGLTNEQGVRYRIIIAEGVSSWRITNALKIADFLTGPVTKVSREGSLAPNSYEVSFGTSRDSVIQLMEKKQKDILFQAWEDRDLTSPLKTVDEALILASIIEKETGLVGERALVASVFINRLKNNMRLQTDPSVIYGLTKGRKVLGRGLKRSELILDTPYNTYVNTGLPPTPIANPGKLAILAALNPAKTDYLFFVDSGSGGHAFARDLRTHNKNVAIWRELNK